MLWHHVLPSSSATLTPQVKDIFSGQVAFGFLTFELVLNAVSDRSQEGIDKERMTCWFGNMRLILRATFVYMDLIGILSLSWPVWVGRETIAPTRWVLPNSFRRMGKRKQRDRTARMVCDSPTSPTVWP